MTSKSDAYWIAFRDSVTYTPEQFEADWDAKWKPHAFHWLAYIKPALLDSWHEVRGDDWKKYLAYHMHKLYQDDKVKVVTELFADIDTWDKLFARVAWPNHLPSVTEYNEQRQKLWRELWEKVCQMVPFPYRTFQPKSCPEWVAVVWMGYCESGAADEDRNEHDAEDAAEAEYAASKELEF